MEKATEKTGKIGPYRYLAKAMKSGDDWKPFLEFSGNVITFPVRALFQTPEEAFTCAMAKAQELANVPPQSVRVTPKKRCKKKKEELDSTKD